MDMDITSTIFVVLVIIVTEELMIDFSEELNRQRSKERIIPIIVGVVFTVALLIIGLPKNEKWEALIYGTNLPSPIANWYTWGFFSVLLPTLLISLLLHIRYPLSNEKGFRFWALVTLLISETVYLIFYGLFISGPNRIVTNGTLQQLSIPVLEQAVAFFYHFAFLGIFFLIANISLAIDHYLDSSNNSRTSPTE